MDTIRKAEFSFVFEKNSGFQDKTEGSFNPAVDSVVIQQYFKSDCFDKALNGFLQKLFLPCTMCVQYRGRGVYHEYHGRIS